MRTRTSRVGAAAAVLTLGLSGLLQAPATAKPAPDTAPCVEYDGLATAPKGSIPRDDLMTVRKDPTAAWVAANKSKASQALKSRTAVTIPVVFHVIR